VTGRLKNNIRFAGLNTSDGIKNNQIDITGLSEITQEKINTSSI
jgi:hypothetical protein